MFAYLEKCKDLRETAAQYRDGSVEIINPREEAAEIFEALSYTLMGFWANDLHDVTKVSAGIYNNLLLLRRCVTYHCWSCLILSFSFQGVCT